MERIHVKWWFGERQKSLSTYNFLDDEIKESHIKNAQKTEKHKNCG
jgi:hypothetical protein